MINPLLKPMAQHADKIISEILKSVAVSQNVPVNKVVVITHMNNKIQHHFFVGKKKVYQCTTEELFRLEGENIEIAQKTPEQEIHDVLSEIPIDGKMP